MANVAPFVDGKLDLGTSWQEAQKESKSSSSLDKDAFLQLLVAQMKYQDPLEPTSNTEYISQLATFSELEEMQNLNANNELQRASALVGKEVIVKSVSDTGKITYESGQVDYVVFENGKAILGVKGGEYPLDDVDTVADADYLEAYNMATALIYAVSKLPSLLNLSTANKEAVQSIQQIYESMNDYQKSFISEDDQKLIEDYIKKMDELIEIEKNNQPNDGGSDGE
ncbi:MAG: flagellar hook capping protein [Lachnospiraceae bacterium]|nr:flagellar hook capping protein [Lachnospiraceae bacterium]